MFEQVETRIISNGYIIEYYTKQIGRGDKVEKYFKTIDEVNEYIKVNLRIETVEEIKNNRPTSQYNKTIKG